ncbi:hypothetical protein CJD92_22380 [Salmonella enterica subsp. enterica serovar Newport]|nr:hypothetical protein [Salmonella enterica subsp. enterica serovar Newport]
MAKYTAQLKKLKTQVIKLAESNGIKLTGDEFDLEVSNSFNKFDIHFNVYGECGAQGNVFYNGYTTEKGLLNGITKTPRIEEVYKTVIQWLK